MAWIVPALFLAVVGGLAVTGCRELTGSQPLPSGVNSPSFYQTQAGALGMRNAAMYQLAQVAIPHYVAQTGLLTDEFQSNLTGISIGTLSQSSLSSNGSVNERILPELQLNVNGGGSNLQGPSGDVYTALQGARGSMMQAIGALAAYDSASNSSQLQGELYALEGYTEILLADFFCSGVPLSTLDFQRDYTYHPSSTTDEVYQDAIAKLDTALLRAPGNDSLQNLVAVLKGRALLDLGQYAQAAQAVAAVPDGFQYQLFVPWTSIPVAPGGSNTKNAILDSGTVADREGVNGLPFMSSHDPRTAVTTTDSVQLNGFPNKIQLHFPARYQITGFSPFPVANWIEARLIQAEAALQANDNATWLQTLNTLRETATVPGQTTTLSDTTDPGSDTARVSLMFYERAFWLFASGHREGDLRRLIRQYGRQQDQVYPVGLYTAPGAGFYGSDVTAPIPPNEDYNPLFHGCLDRNA